MFIYPKDDLDTPSKAGALVGGYWIEVYEGKDQVEDLVSARSTLWQQARDEWEEVYRTKSRHLIDPFSIKNWLYFPILKSQGITTTKLFGGGRSYGDSTFNYGDIIGYAWDLPTDVVSLSQIYNRISDPSVSMFEGIDFKIDTGLNKIIFNKDPFSNGGFANQTVNNQDGTTDELLALWAFRPKIDKRSIQLIYGQPIDIDGRSSPEYKLFVNSVYDSLILGMSTGRLGLILSGALEVPVALENETVELVTDDARKVIVTDKRVHFVPTNSEPIVSVGDKVVKGQSVTDALIIRELRRNANIDDIYAINLTRGFINNEFVYDLGFVNKEVVPTITSDDNGYTVFKFEVGGHPFDVENFWEMVHERGLANDYTLAQGLDKRVDKVGEPSEESLPSTINPLRFLVDEMIPGGFTLVTISVDSINPDLPRMGILPDLTSLGNGIFFIFEAPLAIDDEFDVQSTSESGFTAAETISEYGTTELLNSAVSLKSVSSSCG